MISPLRPDMADLLALRAGVEGDHALIYSSWLRTYRMSHFASEVSGPVYMVQHAAIIHRLLEHCAVVVAHPLGDDVTVIGWRVSIGGVLHYVYVKGEFRGRGVGKMLVPAGAFHFASHEAQGASAKRLTRGMLYNPYLALEAK